MIITISKYTTARQILAMAKLGGFKIYSRINRGTELVMLNNHASQA
jgi:hypothetical protein